MYKYDIVLCSSYGSEEAEIRFIQLLMQKQVEGIIIASEIETTKIAESINKYKVQFVYLNRFTIFLKHQLLLLIMKLHRKDG